MDWETAKGIGDQVVAHLRPACERIEIAGSVRRMQAVPKDLEIAYVAKMAPQRVNLFDEVDTPMTDAVIKDLIDQEFWHLDNVVKRNGPKYKRLIHDETGLVVDLFRAEMGNWGLVLALRTGPAEFNRLLVTSEMKGGAMPYTMKMKDGWLWRGGVPVPTQTEQEFFEMMDLPYWPPAERSAVRLVNLVHNRF